MRRVFAGCSARWHRWKRSRRSAPKLLGIVSVLDANTAIVTASRSPLLPAVPGPAHVTGLPSPVSGPWCAGPRCPWPVPFPPRPPPGLPGPACSASLLAPWVRSLRWYYGTGRLPASVRHGRVRVVHRADLAAMAKVRRRGSRVPHLMFPCLPGVFDPARCVYALPKRRACCGLPRVRSASAPRLAISGLTTLPARSPGNASRASVPRPAQDSGPAWVARPSLSETCTPSHRAGLSRHTRTLGLQPTPGSCTMRRLPQTNRAPRCRLQADYRYRVLLSVILFTPGR